MGRPKIAPKIRRYIHNRANQDKSISREILADLLIKEIINIGEKPPSRDYVIQMISKARNSLDPLEKKWTTAACDRYPQYFPIGSVLDIFLCQKKSEERLASIDLAQVSGGKLTDCDGLTMTLIKATNKFYTDKIGHAMHEMTIRQAKWFVRLKPTVDEIGRTVNGFTIDKLSILPLLVAKVYAQEEMFEESLEKKEFDSSKIDELLFSARFDDLFNLKDESLTDHHAKYVQGTKKEEVYNSEMQLLDETLRTAIEEYYEDKHK